MPPLTLDVKLGQSGDMRWGDPDYDPSEQGAEIVGDAALTTNVAPEPKEPAEVKGAQATKGGESGKAGEVLDLVRTQIGVDYVYGGSQWGKGLDCSGLIQEAFKRAGLNIARVTYDQVKQGQAVSDLSQARPGDLIFSVGDRGMRVNGHVGIYIGNGQWIAAPRTGQKVQIQSVPKNVTAIRRYF